MFACIFMKRKVLYIIHGFGLYEWQRSGVEFPKRSVDASPIFTPPVTHPTLNLAQPGYGMPSNSSRRLDETMATEIESLR
jgi:hypothetical protein